MSNNPKLHPRAGFFLASHHLNPFSAMEKMPVSVARKAYEFFAITQGGIPPKILNIENHVLNFESIEHSIPIRIYSSSNQLSPLLILFMGAGGLLEVLIHMTHYAEPYLKHSAARFYPLSTDWLPNIHFQQLCKMCS